MEKINLIDADAALNASLNPSNNTSLVHLDDTNVKQVRNNFLSLIALAPGADTRDIITVLQYISQFEDRIIKRDELVNLIAAFQAVENNEDIYKLGINLINDPRFDSKSNIKLSDFNNTYYSSEDIDIITQIFNFQIKL